MYPFDKDNPARIISNKLLLKPLLRTGLSANKITVLNFLTLGLGSIVLFALRLDYLGLLTAGLMAMVDYCDGSMARARKEQSKLGAYLDTSLDYLYLMLLIGVLGWEHDLLFYSYVSMIGITFGNWVQYNGKNNLELPFFLKIVFILPVSILIQRIDWGLFLIAYSQLGRTLIIYERSIKWWKDLE